MPELLYTITLSIIRPPPPGPIMAHWGQRLIFLKQQCDYHTFGKCWLTVLPRPWFSTFLDSTQLSVNIHHPISRTNLLTFSQNGWVMGAGQWPGKDKSEPPLTSSHILQHHSEDLMASRLKIPILKGNKMVTISTNTWVSISQKRQVSIAGCSLKLSASRNSKNKNSWNPIGKRLCFVPS